MEPRSYFDVVEQLDSLLRVQIKKIRDVIAHGEVVVAEAERIVVPRAKNPLAADTNAVELLHWIRIAGRPSEASEHERPLYFRP